MKSKVRFKVEPSMATELLYATSGWPFVPWRPWDKPIFTESKTESILTIEQLANGYRPWLWPFVYKVEQEETPEKMQADHFVPDAYERWHGVVFEHYTEGMVDTEIELRMSIAIGETALAMFYCLEKTPSLDRDGGPCLNKDEGFVLAKRENGVTQTVGTKTLHFYDVHINGWMPTILRTRGDWYVREILKALE